MNKNKEKALLEEAKQSVEDMQKLMDDLDEDGIRRTLEYTILRYSILIGIASETDPVKAEALQALVSTIAESADEPMLYLVK